MNLFFTQNIEKELAFLPETEARHCVQVLRKSVGDSIHFVDGKGGLYEGTIQETGKKKCIVKIEKATQSFEKRDYYLHIAIAPTKNIDRFEWFLEKATEIGIDEITPLLCEHSERKRIRLDRLEKIALSAMKQSLKAFLPKVNDLTKFSDFINTVENDKSEKFIAHCQENEKTHLKNNSLKDQNVTILIGPEGDFSPAEIQKANQHDFGSVTLGTSRLRTETAGVVACHIVNLLNY
jgi:16S rRNA (uracil1498-N3)-methyltransferase